MTKAKQKDIITPKVAIFNKFLKKVIIIDTYIVYKKLELISETYIKWPEEIKVTTKNWTVSFIN